MKTPITYYGGKQTMLKHILPLIPSHSIYTESFCGGCAVLFAKRPSKSEIINDLNSDLINFYSMTQRYYTDVKLEIDRTLHSRSQHKEAAQILSTGSEDAAKRAWAVWALSKMSFASMQDGSFGYDFGGTIPKKIINAKDEFTEMISRRLERVTIECRDALDVIRCYDTPDTFHFVDPPYINSNCGHYEGMFDDELMTKLLELLTSIEGKFMLTMFPYESIEQFSKDYGWIIHRVERTISASKTKRRKQEEWIVCNYIADSERQGSLF